MRSFAFDTPRLSCLPLTHVDSDEFIKLVEEASFGQQRSYFSNPYKLLDRVHHSGYVAAGAFLKDSRISMDGCPTLVGCICGVPLDRYLFLDFIIFDEYRQQGFGSELLNGFMWNCHRENRIRGFCAQVEESNLATISFLESLEFSVYPGGDFTVIVSNTAQSFHTYHARFKEV